MSTYLYTLSFLLIMSLLTSSEMLKFTHDSVETRLYTQSQVILAEAEESRELAHLEQFRLIKNDQEPIPREKKKRASKKANSKVRRSAPLRFNTSRPPNNSRLNFYLLLFPEHQLKAAKNYSLYEVAARLMQILYGEHPLFQSIPGAERRILNRLLAQKEKAAQFTTPDELSSLPMEDTALQDLFYTLLTGTEDLPPLLNYITFDRGDAPLSGQRAKINLMSADPALLMAIFDNQQITDHVVAIRDALWEEIFDQEEHRLERTTETCKTRSQIKDILEEKVHLVFAEYGLNADRYKSGVFDYGLGDLGSILFLEDPLTGTMIRKKYKDGAHTKHK